MSNAPSDSPLDLAFVRAQFPAFAEPSLAAQRHFENAGGSWASQHSIDALSQFYRQTKLQPYHPHPSAQAAGAAMDRAYARWGQALGVAAHEVVIGPSTSQNTYVLAQAFAELLAPGDEVIVTNQDHEANRGVWQRMAERAGATLKVWEVDPQSGLLHADALAALLSPATRLVTLPHCSNIVGHKNPVADWTAQVRVAAPGAFVAVDGVSHAPHGLTHVGQLGCDAYYFSLYKVFGVHQGVMVVRDRLAQMLPNQSHFFNGGHPQKRLNPAGPDHAQIAASQAVLDYFEALMSNHGAASLAELNSLIEAHEAALSQPLLDYLSAKNSVRLLGPADAAVRHPTISLVAAGRSSAQIATALGERGIACGNGHFYAHRLVEAMGEDPENGVVRLSMVHYTSPDDVAAAIQALEAVL